MPVNNLAYTTSTDVEQIGSTYTPPSNTYKPPPTYTPPSNTYRPPPTYSHPSYTSQPTYHYEYGNRYQTGPNGFGYQWGQRQEYR
jgi:hypothetical protein